MTSSWAQAKPGLGEGIVKWARHAPHALVTALIMFTLGHLGWLDWLERTTIELAAATSSFMPRIDVRSARESSANYENDTPRTVLITEEEFQRDYRERSPLDRRRLKEVVEAVLIPSADAPLPSVVAMDIDLSPISGASTEEQSAQEELDELLLRGAHNTTVVLVIPFPSSTAQRIAINAQWMRKMCRGPHVLFAYSYVARNQGVVTKIHPGFPSLANVAFDAWMQGKGVGNSPEAASRPTANPACAAVLNEGNPPPFLDSLFTDAVTRPLRERKALKPMNTNYFEEALAERYTYASSDIPSGATNGRVVFVGADFRGTDSLMTASGTYPGVLVHSATFFTRMNPVVSLSEWLLFIIETLVGLGLLRAFSWLWGRYLDDFDAAPARRGLLAQLGAILRASRWAAAVLFITACVALLSVALSGFLLAQATWFNFAPIAIAVAIKAKDTASQVEISRTKAGKAAPVTGASRKRGRRPRDLLSATLSGILKHRWLLAFAVLAGVLVFAQ